MFENWNARNREGIESSMEIYYSRIKREEMAVLPAANAMRMNNNTISVSISVNETTSHAYIVY